jgi:hypothetical protein
MSQPDSGSLSRYSQILERIFLSRFQPGMQAVSFTREEFASICHELGIRVPRNLGDILYSARYRTGLPLSIKQTAPEGFEWVLPAAGRGQYQFALRRILIIGPNTALAETKVADATPGIIAMYTSGDEQALLAEIRYNRLIDIFTGVTCYSLQNHLRTTVPGMGQVETDELYVGIDKRGAHYIIPIQAKSKSDRIGVVQIEQDFALCAHRFPNLFCLPIAAQFMDNDLIALFSFELDDGQVRINAERHYRLVSPESLTESDLAAYRLRPLE